MICISGETVKGLVNCKKMFELRLMPSLHVRVHDCLWSSQVTKKVRSRVKVNKNTISIDQSSLLGDSVLELNGRPLIQNK